MRHIIHHLIRHNILHSYQSAYVPNKSTETTLTRINNDILANDIDTIIVFLDQSAAFETLNLSILTNPNDHFTCSLHRECLGKIANWFKQNSPMLN